MEMNNSKPATANNGDAMSSDNAAKQFEATAMSNNGVTGRKILNVL
jgi:hypothetical protein